MAKKANKCFLWKTFVLIESHLNLHPVSLIFKSVLNYIVRLITPFHWEKKGFVVKNACCQAQNPSLNSFYRGMIACIIDFRITWKRLCREIVWCRLNLVRSVKGVLIQSDTELDPENPIFLWHLLPHNQAVTKLKPETECKSLEFGICKEGKY